MNIGIIGAGNVGSALARASVEAGHTVKLSSREADDAQRLAAEVGASAGSNPEVIAASDAVILAVPFDTVGDVLDEVGDRVAGKILIDVTNRFAAEQVDGTSNAELIQKMAPRSKVVKAINTIFASNQDDPLLDGSRLDGFVAADDEAAKRAVLDYVESLGFRPIDSGPLAMARALEAMGILNIALNMSHGWPWRTGWKLLGPTDSSEA